MNKLSLVSVSLICTLLSPFALAQQPALKIGFVNALKVMEASPQVQEANKRLEAEFAPRQKKLAATQQQIRRMEEDLNKGAATMKEAQSAKLLNDIRGKRRDLERERDEFREDYNIRRNEELDKLQKRIVQVIQTLAREEKYDFIFSDGVVFASERVDITEQVLNRLSTMK